MQEDFLNFFVFFKNLRFLLMIGNKERANLRVERRLTVKKRKKNRGPRWGPQKQRAILFVRVWFKF